MELPFGSAINVRKKNSPCQKGIESAAERFFPSSILRLVLFLSISLSWEKPFPGHLQKTDA
jgi:hypothetical protein